MGETISWLLLDRNEIAGMNWADKRMQARTTTTAAADQMLLFFYTVKEREIAQLVVEPPKTQEEYVARQLDWLESLAKVNTEHFICSCLFVSSSSQPAQTDVTERRKKTSFSNKFGHPPFSASHRLDLCQIQSSFTVASFAACRTDQAFRFRASLRPPVDGARMTRYIISAN